MKTLYESIMDDDEVVMSHARESGFRFSVDQMLNSGVADKQLIRELESKAAVYPVANDNILDIVKRYIKVAGKRCSLNWIDTSKVTSMNSLFSNSSTNRFNGDISDWDVSNVRDMSFMFYNSKFNRDISDWDVSNVRDMAYMFRYSEFNKDISKWDVSNVRDMNSMFYSSEFNRDISNWDVSNVENMIGMFEYSKFNQDISNWNVKKVKKYVDIFTDCSISSVHKPKFR